MKKEVVLARAFQIVIPAHAGIQAYSAELTRIPAFAGMTDAGRLFILAPSLHSRRATRMRHALTSARCDAAPG